MEKLQVDSLPKLIRFAAKLGLTDMEADVV